MARTVVDGEIEDALFRAFEDAQGLQRRIFRVISRRHYNEQAVAELRTQASRILKEIEGLPVS